MNKIAFLVLTGLTIFVFLFLSFFVFLVIRSNVIDIGNQRIDYFLFFKDLIFVILWLLLIPLILKLFKKLKNLESK